jgi:hypothetical protein
MRFLGRGSLFLGSLLAAIAACVGDDPVAATPGNDAGTDTNTETGPADSGADTAQSDAGTTCDPLAPFTKFEPVAGDVNTSSFGESKPTLTDDETEMVFFAHGTRNDGGAFADDGDHEIWAGRRPTRSDPWSASIVGELASKVIDGGVNGTGKTGIDLDPAVSGNGLTLVYASQRAGFGPYELFMSTRTSRTVVWEAPAIIESLKDPAFDTAPHFSVDGSRLYFVSDRTGTANVYEAPVNGGAIGAPSPLVGPINEAPTGYPVLSADGLVIYVQRLVAPDMKRSVIWRATRGSTSQAFGAPAAVPELERGYTQMPGWLSRDGCRLYYTFRETVDAAADIWIASR